MSYSTKFVIQVNEIYHDLEEADYQIKHSEIFHAEVDRWKKIGARFLSHHPRPLVFLDIGCGTGFVPLQLVEFLSQQDRLICADLSSNMLDICRLNLTGVMPGKLDFLKLNGYQIDLTDGSVDFITLNSVLHHIPNLDSFFAEVKRILKSGGYLLMGHEPQKRFFEHKFLHWNYRLVYALVNPRRALGLMLKRFGLLDGVQRFRPRSKSTASINETLRNSVNQALLKEELITTPLSAAELSAIVDIQSPTAGGLHQEHGFDLDLIRHRWLPNFSFEYVETYRHLSKVSMQNGFTCWYDSFLQKRFPNAGSTFFIVLQKR